MIQNAAKEKNTHPVKISDKCKLIVLDFCQIPFQIFIHLRKEFLKLINAKGSTKGLVAACQSAMLRTIWIIEMLMPQVRLWNLSPAEFHSMLNIH
ncbi:hypothetical protein TNCT_172841 [Trichonephila clavata]|uniref:Uncharacterized protein n=1 Tax=Trichonephila clavata TaxID=2740835 RepID=A0A8X6GU65_TRICU|nr:hypothetical protein TNCT_172841 [Trichonephila clavata]